MADWFRQGETDAGVWRTTEPAVNSWFRASLYTVIGRDACLQFDFGMGLRALRPYLTQKKLSKLFKYCFTPIRLVILIILFTLA